MEQKKSIDLLKIAVTINPEVKASAGIADDRALWAILRGISADWKMTFDNYKQKIEALYDKYHITEFLIEAGFITNALLYGVHSEAIVVDMTKLKQFKEDDECKEE